MAGDLGRFHDDVPVGKKSKTFDTINTVDGSERDKKEIERKFRELAAADLATNGEYANAPYKVRHNGRRYKAKIKITQVAVKVELCVTDEFNYHAVPKQEEFTRVEVQDPMTYRP